MEMAGKGTGRDFSQDRETPREPRSSGNPRRRVGWKFRPARLARTVCDATHVPWTHQPAVTWCRTNLIA